MITSALSFLSNSRVSASPLSRRLAFLESKGLTSAEIAEAVKRQYKDSSAEYKVVSEGVAKVCKANTHRVQTFAAMCCAMYATYAVP